MNEEPSLLTFRDVSGLLRAAAHTVEAELAALPERALAWHPAPGEWCVKEVLGHLIEAGRRGFNGRIRAILAAPESALTAWNQAAVARERRDCERHGEDLLREFLALRDDSLVLVAGLREENLGHGGYHPTVGYLRLVDLLHEWVHHDRNHIRQIFANVQAYAWPHLGNAQRFSQP